MSTRDLRRYTSRTHRAARFVAQRMILGPVSRVLMEVRTRGVDLVDVPELRQGAYVLVANHTSHLDAVLLATALPWSLTRNLTFGAAADYFFVGRVRRAASGLFFHTFPVDRPARSASGSAARGLAFALVEAGVPVALFPEGTRSRTGQMAAFGPGAALVARRGRVPVVPAAVRGAARVMPPGGRLRVAWPRPRVELVLGEPLRPAPGESVRAFAGRVEEVVRSMAATGVPRRAAEGPGTPGTAGGSA